MYRITLGNKKKLRAQAVSVLMLQVSTLNQYIMSSRFQGRSQEFSKGGLHGAKTRFLTRFSCHFYHLFVGCLLKTWLTKGGEVLTTRLMTFVIAVDKRCK